jgi:hypothetical protein
MAAKILLRQRKQMVFAWVSFAVINLGIHSAVTDLFSFSFLTEPHVGMYVDG